MKRVQFGAEIVEFPADMPDADIERVLAKQHASAVPPPAAPAATASTLQIWNPVGKNFDTGVPIGASTTNFLAGAGKSLYDTARGLRQIGADLTGSDTAELRAEQDEVKRLDAPLMDTGAGLAGNITGQVVQMVAPLGVAAKTTKGAQLAKDFALRFGTRAPYVAAAAQGGTQAALQPVGTDESRTLNTAAGAAVGPLAQKIVGSVGSLAQRVMQPVRPMISPPMAGVAADFQALGGQLTPGMRTQSPTLRRIESALESNPATSAPFDAIKRNNQEILNRAATSRIGQPGESNLSQSVLGAADDAIGAKFDAVAGENISLGRSFLSDISATRQKFQDVWGGRGDATAASLFNDAAAEARAGAITGERYVQLRSELSKTARDAYRGQNSRLGEAAEGLIDALDSAAQASLPMRMSAALKTARGEWKSLITVEKALQGENVSGAKLAAVLRKADPVGFGRGKQNNDLYTAARFADQFRSIVGDSGTATRLGTQLALTGASGAGLAALTGGDVTQGAMYGLGAPIALRGATAAYLSGPAQRYLSHGISLLPPQPIRDIGRGLLATSNEMAVPVSGGLLYAARQ